VSAEEEVNIPDYIERVKGAPLTKKRVKRNGSNGHIGLTPSDAGPPADRKAEIIEALNQEYALVMVGGGVAVLREGTDAEGRFEYRLMSTDAFREKLRPQKEFLNEKPVGHATIWLNDARRREYDGIVFAPGLETPKYYNLWREPEIEPNATASCARFLDHVFHNVCRGEDALFAWVMGWFASIFQFPRAKTGNALVLRGAQGAGKTIVGQIVGRLLGRHYTLAGDPRFVTGRFNAHLANCLLLQLDEATWGGDHVATGKLKDLITGDTQMIEFKGKEPITVKNYVRLMISSNNDWVVPAGLEERRFATLDIGEEQMQNASYFRAIMKEQATGGDGALLHYLRNFDLSEIDLSQIPRTAALFEQKNASLTPEMSWWLDVLHAGQLPGDKHGTGTAPVVTVYDAYLEHARNRGVTRRGNDTALGIFLHRYVPDLTRARLTLDSGRRTYCYEFPKLSVCRRAFDLAARTASAWDPLEEWSTDARGDPP
jgi:hypothetical protein